MSRSIKKRHKPINGICYVYKVVSEETYEGRCTDPEHNPPPRDYDETFENGRKRRTERSLARGKNLEPRAGIHVPLSPREGKRKR